MSAARVTVLGAGLWGTTLAQHLAAMGCRVTLWEFDARLVERLQRRRTHPNLKGFKLARSVRATSDLAEAAKSADVLLAVLPSQHLRGAARKLRTLFGPKAPWRHVVSASKGLEARTLKTMSEVLEEELSEPRGGFYALSGPSFAKEVARGVPTGLALAGVGKEPPRELVRVFDGGAIKVSPSADRKGTELGGALKNVMAVACGLIDGMGLGANTKALMIVEGVAEMAEVIRHAGGDVRTVYGLAGLGDFVATGTSGLSRNRTFGEHLGRGLHAREALKAVRTVVEGAESAEGAYRLCQALGVKAPLLTAVWRILEREKPPRHLLETLGFEGRL